MDPLTAVAFAGTIITFVDFSWSLLTGTYDVYGSSTGMTQQNARINDIISDLRDVSADLEGGLPVNSKHEKALRDLAAECSELAEELAALLKRLKRDEKKNSLWSSLKVKWASLMKAGDVEDMMERLWDYRSQIMLRLSLILCDQESLVARQLERIRKEATQLNAKTTEKLEKIREEVLSVVSMMRRRENEDPFGLQTGEIPQGCTIDEINGSLGQVRALLIDLVAQTKGANLQHTVLRQLNFDSRLYREDTINNAEMGTYEWMLEDREDKNNVKNDQDHNEEDDDGWKKPVFLRWLEDGSHIFHISGKAGSGKSTLVKFLYADQRTMKGLKRWAGAKKLVLAHFYFWQGSKNEIQMSLNGLYRSILFEVLCQCPDLIPKAFPKQWKLVESQAVMGHSNEVWQMPVSDIYHGFQHLMASMASNPTHRFCFFIDGLDEYHGDSASHWEMARNLQALTRQSDIKICTSARPHTEFLVTFNDATNTIIHLHELTRRDITNFSRRMFARDPNAAVLPDKFWEDLALRITDRAEGVFLWAWLTVRLLLDSVGRLDKPEILLQRLEGVPDALDQLYEKLLGSVLGADQRRSDLMLLLAIKNPFGRPLNAIMYNWLDDLEDPDFPMCHRPPSFCNADPSNVIDYVRRQLHSLTKGLLELGRARDEESRLSAFYIQFFHRSAFDFLNRNCLPRILERQAGLDLVDIFGRLRLAEFWHTEKHSIRDRRHLLLLEMMGWSKFRNELSTAVIDGFEAVLNSEPIWSTGKFIYGLYRGPTIARLYAEGNRMSWPHFMAAHGQTRYLTHLVTRNPGLLCFSSKAPKLNLVASAVEGRDTALVEFLLNQGASPHDFIEVRQYHNHDKAIIPVWLLVVGNTIMWMACWQSKSFGNRDPEAAFQVAKLLTRGIVDKDVVFEVTWDKKRVLTNRPLKSDEEVTRKGNERPDSEFTSYCFSMREFFALYEAQMAAMQEALKNFEDDLGHDQHHDRSPLQDWKLKSMGKTVSDLLIKLANQREVWEDKGVNADHRVIEIVMKWEGQSLRLPLRHKVY
ncbi:hypothetical protein QBC42DRAFT_265318 [Cladorrhinum samala]|uniref:NACHT domain-containing protein n=1 Tax=Cladorrhinum samala TaxID=585594 RepID=A0AAV9HTJ2_9PEZI|nr:hypothetical protein QBC42DRAFT_265318 [Cladorrhinum samala]